MTPAEIAQAQLDAYNAQDLDAHCAWFTDDVVVATPEGDVLRQGIAAYRDFYGQLFAQYPNNRAEALYRMVIGNTVIDHERVNRGAGDGPFEVAAIYTLRDGKIARAVFVR
jgi:hypothetical protein